MAADKSGAPWRRLERGERQDMRILVKEQDNIISDVVFPREPIHVGSQPGCSVYLPDMRVDLIQAVLSPCEDGGWVVESTAPGVKTWLNGHVLNEPKKISNGDQISVEDYTLNVYLAFDENEAADHSAPSDPAPTSVSEEFPLPHGTIVRFRPEALTLSPRQVDDLSRFALRLSVCGELSSLMESVLTELLPHFGARAAWIGVRRQGRGPLQYIQGRDVNEAVFDMPKLYNSLLNRCVDRAGSVWIPQLDDADVGSILAVPLVSPQGTLGLIYLDSKKGAEAFSETQFLELVALARVVANHLDSLIREQVQIRKAATSAEASIVQAIQARLDPQALPEWPALQIAAHSKPGQESAGDVYDIMQVPSGAAAFLIGHVWAPPVVAAVAMIEARAAFRIAVLHSAMPHVMMQELNWLLCSQPEKLTMQCGIILVDPNNGALLHTVAGPSCAVVIGRSGLPRRLGDNAGPPLGTTPNRQYATARGLLGQNETLAMYTQGVGKLQNEKGQQLPEDRFLESICDGFGMPARIALDETLTDLSSYSERGYQPDDVTILLAHRPGDGTDGN